MKTQEQKDLLLQELKNHQIADEFVRGSWLQPDGVRGCFYGCAMKTQDSPREKFAEKYDIDLWYCYITEKIFENLPEDKFKSFPYESIDILPLNFDFDSVKSAFHKALLLKQLDWIKDEEVREVLINTAKLFDNPFSTIDEAAARSAARSARSAARSSAWSAAESAAESAESAWSAAESAEAAARSARSAEAAARSAAKENHYLWMRDTLFEIIKNDPQYKS